MRKPYFLTPNNPVQVVDVDFPVLNIAVTNPTASPIYVRIGAPDTPGQDNADRVIPAASAITFPVVGAGRTFCFALGDPTALALPGSSILSGLQDSANIDVLGNGEMIPSYGLYSFLSLSVAALTPGNVPIVNPTTTSATFDLLPWGGALVYILPASGSGQGVCTVQASNDAATWQNVVSFAFWRNTPMLVNVAKTLRYMRVILNATAIPGEANISGVYNVRASLAEIQQTTWSAGAGEINYGFSVAPLSTQSIIYCTVGLRAINVRISASAGNNAEVVFYTSSSPSGPWALASYREQIVSGFYNSIYRSIGNVDSYLKVDLLDLSGVTFSGSIRTSIQEAPDTVSVLERIYSALGDQGQPVNVGQSIFHVLTRIYNAIGTGVLTTILNNLYTASNNYFASAAPNIASLVTLLTTQQTERRATTEYFFYPMTVTTSGVIVPSGSVLAAYAGRYIVSATLNYRTTGRRVPPQTIYYGIGTAGGINQYVYRTQEYNDMPSSATPAFPYGSPTMGAGIIIPAGRDNIWLYSDSPITADIIMTIR